MALGFIKKIFSFGNQPEDQQQQPAPQPQPPAPAPAPQQQPEPEIPPQPEPAQPQPVQPEVPTPQPAPEPAISEPAPQEVPAEDTPAEVPVALPPEEPAQEPAPYEPQPSPEVPLEVPAPIPVETEQPLRDREPAPEQTALAPVSPTPRSTPDDRITVGKTVERPTQLTAAEVQRAKWLQRLRNGLSRSSRELGDNLAGVFTRTLLTEEIVEELEEVLIRADLGVETAMKVADKLAEGRFSSRTTEEDVRRVVAGEVESVLTPVAKPLELNLAHKPHVILVVGVNGTGKTTTIGKLAAKLTAGGVKVMLAAGDTFRAAAIEQLKIWGERTGAPVISSRLGADAASLAYEAFAQAKQQQADVLIIDTAGRLQNKAELMDELDKIVRVLKKLDPEAPHTILQTVDATTGQNAMNQVEIFRNVAGVNGLVLTKLDGTARGGILVAIAAKHKLPVYFIGVGEQVDDLEPFSASDFARTIAGLT
ncbi:signal recognition particle-docking protein FtsY [Tianweitania sp. BSSL-BM11]|uniref:Signal recognition particle receptor FtsY n=1 Tax=Tianweitania aestuarii TaxID=2814886 RepID=A0ABS5S1C4_9HYPH|nr:signal recognition particle-docking protein FtsY [Tianweitania aestuarii]MBS9722279.1 signal recognition particle-docking protein FtsY [Tianweitania aestuarii]